MVLVRRTSTKISGTVGSQRPSLRTMPFRLFSQLLPFIVVWLISSTKQQMIAFSISAPAFRPLPHPIPLQ